MSERRTITEYKKVFCASELDGDTLDEIIDRFTKLRAEYSGSTRLDYDYDEYGVYRVLIERPETDGEAYSRNAIEQRDRANQLAQFKRLKSIFEPGS